MITIITFINISAEYIDVCHEQIERILASDRRLSVANLAIPGW